VSSTSNTPPTVVVQPSSSSAFEAGGRVAESLIGGFVNAPALLLICILNIAMIAAAAYYLARQEEHRVAGIAQVTELLRMCIRGAPGAP